MGLSNSCRWNDWDWWNYGELWGIMVELWGIMGNHVELWGIMGNYGELWGVMVELWGIMVELWGIMGNYGMAFLVLLIVVFCRRMSPCFHRHVRLSSSLAEVHRVSMELEEEDRAEFKPNKEEEGQGEEEEEEEEDVEWLLGQAHDGPRTRAKESAECPPDF